MAGTARAAAAEEHVEDVPGAEAHIAEYVTHVALVGEVVPVEPSVWNWLLTPACPYLSYRSRFCLSISTSYASEISLKRSSATWGPPW